MLKKLLKGNALYKKNSLAVRGLDNNEFLDLVWHIGLNFEKIFPKDWRQFVKNVCREVEYRDFQTHFWAIACLRDAFFSDYFIDERLLYIQNWFKLLEKNDHKKIDLINHISNLYQIANSSERSEIIKDISQQLSKNVNNYAQEELENIITFFYPKLNDELRNELKIELTSAQAKTKVNFIDLKANVNTINPKCTDCSKFNPDNITLIVPEFLSGSSFLQPPLGLLTAAAYLKQNGFKVQFIDNRVQRLCLDSLNSYIQNPGLIFVTTTPYDQVQNYYVDYRLHYTFKTVNFLKKTFPNSMVIICGAHGTLRPDLIFLNTIADIVILGEYEKTIYNIADALRAQKNISSVPNIAVRIEKKTSKSNFILTEYRESLRRLSGDEILPAYDFIDFKNYFGDCYINNKPTRIYNWGVILASRGCRYKCSFCHNFWGTNVRYRKPESILKEIIILKKYHGVHNFFFCDFTFTQNEIWVEKLCSLISKSDLDVHWACETRCDLINRNLLKKMSDSGCNRLWLGIESFDNNIIIGANKYNNSENAIQSVELCREVGIEPSAFLMLGLPGETINTLNHTLKLVHTLKIVYSKSIIVATPRFGTSYYEMAKKQYPWLGNSFFELNAVRGLVGNELTPSLLERCIDIFRERSFIYEDNAPCLSL